jgi:glycerol uptake operon antiterminator
MFFDEHPIIAAVRDRESFAAACASSCKVIFLVSADLLSLPELTEMAHKERKLLFLHIDLAEGVGKDAAGIRYVKQCGLDGIISTRSSLIKSAKEEGITCVQRFFMIDSHSVDTALTSIRSSHPDMIEIMPGIVTKTFKRLSDKVDVPIIAGGLLEEKEEIIAALSSGADAVSTGKKELWNL